MDVQEQISKRRAGRTWTALSKELGVTRMTLYNVWHGFTQPSDKLLRALGLERKERIVRQKAVNE